MSKFPSRIVPRNGVLQYRRRVPDDVRKLGGFEGKEIFQVSLKTRDPVAARQEAARREEWFEAECARVRGVERPRIAANSNDGMVLTDEYLKQVQDRHVAKALGNDFREAIRSERDPQLREWIEERDDWLAPVYVVNRDGSIVDRAGTDARRAARELEEVKRRVRPDVAYQASRFGAAPGTDDFRRIEATFIEAETRIISGRRERGPTVAFGNSYRPSDAVGPPVKPEATWTFRKLADRYLEVTPSGESWMHKVNVCVELFEEFLGPPTPISAIRRDHIREFVELLQASPQRSTMRFPNLGLREAIRANRARLPRPYPLISPNTIRDNHFAVLRVLLGYACGELGAIPIDPTDRYKVKGASKKGGRSSHFEVEELNDLFRLPLFSGCQSASRTNVPGKLKLDDHQFWTPLIMLFSGARPSEIAQLAVSDVKLRTEHPHFSILTEFDPSDPDDRPYVVAFKTENARRVIPIHPMLLELGFGRYVDRVKREGQDRLFPQWKASRDRRKLYSGATWVRRFNDKIVPEVTQKKPKPTIYSFRHTFKTQMAICRVPPQFQDKVMGHAGPAMDPNYLKTIPIRELHSEVSKVQYPGLDLTHLVR